MTDLPIAQASEAPFSSPLAPMGDNQPSDNVIHRDGLSEDALITSAIAGNEQAFERLFNRYRNRVFLLCLQYCAGDRDQAHDLCQETFISAFLHLRQLRDRSRFFFWLTEIAKNKGISFTRKQRTLLKILEEYRHLKGIMSDAESEWTEAEVQLIEELILSMSNAQLRETVTLFYLEGKKTTEIAKIQAITQTAVTTRLNRFRGKLRKRLAQEILKRRRPS